MSCPAPIATLRSSQDPAIEALDDGGLVVVPELRIDLQTGLDVVRIGRAVLGDLRLDVVEGLRLGEAGREILDEHGLMLRIGSELDELATRIRIRRAGKYRPIVAAPDALIPDDLDGRGGRLRSLRTRHPSRQKIDLARGQHLL